MAGVIPGVGINEYRVEPAVHGKAWICGLHPHERLDERPCDEQQDERHHDLRDESERTSAGCTDDDLALEGDETVRTRRTPGWQQAAEHGSRQRNDGGEREHSPIEIELEL